MGFHVSESVASCVKPFAEILNAAFLGNTAKPKDKVLYWKDKFSTYDEQ